MVLGPMPAFCKAWAAGGWLPVCLAACPEKDQHQTLSKALEVRGLLFERSSGSRQVQVAGLRCSLSRKELESDSIFVPFRSRTHDLAVKRMCPDLNRMLEDRLPCCKVRQQASGCKSSHQLAHGGSKAANNALFLAELTL